MPVVPGSRILASLSESGLRLNFHVQFCHPQTRIRNQAIAFLGECNHIMIRTKHYEIRFSYLESQCVWLREAR
eukprot:1120244-Rhodomonas_salina.2